MTMALDLSLRNMSLVYSCHDYGLGNMRERTKAKNAKSGSSGEE